MVRLLIISLVFFFGTQTYAADCGVFKVVKGEVTFKKKSKNNFKKARKNKKICQGDTVKTAADGRTKIVMSDSNEINVSPSSEMTIETYQSGKKAVLNVLNGKVRSDVKNKYKDSKSSHYRVKTKSAVAGVRGTEFLASYNAATSQARIVTFEGEVAVGQMSGDNFVPKVTVKPGQYTSSSSGQDPHPAKEVPPAELAKMDRESKVASPESSKAPASTEPKKEKDNKNEDDKKDSSAEKPKPRDNGDKPKSSKGKAPGGGGLGSIDGEDSDGQMSDDQMADNPDDGSDFGSDADVDDGASDGSRDVASIDSSADDMGLPDANLEDGPKMEEIVDVDLTPKVDTQIGDVFDRPVEDVTQNPSIQDPGLNQNVRVIIIPTFPEQ